MLRAVVLVVVALAAAPAALAACPPPAETMSAQAFEKLAHGTDPVRLVGVSVRGNVELRETNVPISCRRCAFESLILRDAVVNRLLDLRGLRQVGYLNATGAEFKQPVLIGVGPDCPGIGQASFFFATFDDFAEFEGTAFGLANFSQARFRGPASFASASFRRPASFAGASFEGAARFDDASFAATKELPARFTGASFAGRASFLRTGFGPEACLRNAFEESADFTAASFGAGAELSQSLYCGAATFQRTRFGGGAGFLGAQFVVPGESTGPCDRDRPPDPAIVADRVSSSGPLDFGGVLFAGTTVFLGVSTPMLSFDGAVFARCVPLELTELVGIDDLRLAPSAAGRVPTDEGRVQVLRAVDRSATAREDLAVANDAHYRLLTLTSERENRFQHALDVVFYRGVAGYLVRPFRPLLWLLGIAIFASLLRTLWPKQKPGAAVKPRVRTHSRFERFVAWLNRFLTELGRTLSPTQRAGPDAPLIRKVEGAVYAVLLVCFVIGLANSNPTLKQFVDALL